MYQKRLTHLMDQTLFSCFVLITVLFLMVDIQKDFLNIPLYSTPRPDIEYDYNLDKAEEVIRNISVVRKDDLHYLSFYEPEDAVHIIKYSTMYDIPIIYLYRQDYLESKLGKYPRHQREHGLDIGFKQLNNRYIEYFVEKYFILEKPFDPMNNEHSIQVGCAYLKDLYEEFFCDWRLAFEAYNSGPTRVRSFSVPLAAKEYAQCILHGYSKDFTCIEVSARGIH